MATALPPETSSSSSTVLSDERQSLSTTEEQVSSGVVRLKLHKPQNRKKVSWTNDTVDNEHMGKKKSKCCCVYVKSKEFDESSSEDSTDDECEHCSGHVEQKNKNSNPTTRHVQDS